MLTTTLLICVCFLIFALYKSTTKSQLLLNNIQTLRAELSKYESIAKSHELLKNESNNLNTELLKYKYNSKSKSEEIQILKTKLSETEKEIQLSTVKLSGAEKEIQLLEAKKLELEAKNLEMKPFYPDQNKIKGDDFEIKIIKKLYENLLKPKKFILEEWRSDKSADINFPESKVTLYHEGEIFKTNDKINKIYPKSNTYPDLLLIKNQKFENNQKSKNNQDYFAFAIECKYRSKWDKDNYTETNNISWAKKYQGENYFHYQKITEIPVFVAISVDEDIFIIPLDELIDKSEDTRSPYDDAIHLSVNEANLIPYKINNENLDLIKSDKNINYPSILI